MELFADFNEDNIPDGAALGTATTDATGRYYFNESNVADGDPVTAGAQPGPLAFRTYLISVANSDWNANAGAGVNELLTFSVAPFQTPGPGMAEVRDNDAQLLNNKPTVIAKTAFNAKNIFDFDLGFVQCNVEILNDITLNCSTPFMTIGPNPQNGYIYAWSPPTGLSATNIAQPLANPQTTTTYTLTTNTYCVQTMTVNVDNIPPVADPGPVHHLDCQDTATIIGTPGLPGNNYLWAPPKEISSITDAQPTVSPQSTTAYTVTVTGSNGCMSTATTSVFVESCCTKVTLPTGFTPNGDKLNDTYGVIELEDLRGFSLYIYNRWGQQVFYSTKKEDRWDGNYKGERCENDVYFYLLIYDCAGVSKQLQGDFTLVR